MFRAVRLRLITYVVSVLALVLLAVGVLVYVLLSRQLDAAVDAELRAAAMRALPVGIPRAMATAAGSDAPVEGSFTVRLLTESPVAGARGWRGPGSGGRTAPPPDAPAWRDVGRTETAPSAAPVIDAVAAAAPGRDDLRTVTLDGERYRLLTRVYGPEGRSVAATQTGIPLAARDRQERVVLLALAGGGTLGLALTVAGGLFLTGRALVPLRLAFERQQRFVADASHELRTPLALLRLEAEDLATRLDDPGSLSRVPGPEPTSPASASGTRHGAPTIRPLVRQIDRLARLVDGLLTLARLDGDGLPLEREPLPVAPFLHTAAAQARRLAAPDVSVEVAAPPDLWVSGDPDRLAQVLLILVENACRATGPGERSGAPNRGRITLAAERDGAAVLLTVADNGAGIPPEHAGRVFERFYRVDDARSRESGGVGLGLAIAREIVRAHGGEITLVSAPGQGARVRVRLPVASVPVSEGETSEEAPAPSQPATPQR